MKEFWLQIAGLLAALLVGMYLTFNPNSPLGGSIFNTPPVGSEGKAQLKIDGVIINVEIANTVASRAQGLGGRQSLDPDSGMLFILPKTEQSQFWMKDMLFPLDMIWIKDNTVVGITPDVANPAPNTSDNKLQLYEPTEPVDKVLEVNANFAAEHGVKVGDNLQTIQQ